MYKIIELMCIKSNNLSFEHTKDTDQTSRKQSDQSGLYEFINIDLLTVKHIIPNY